MVYTPLEIEEIIKHLNGAKMILDGQSELKIPGCKAAIDIAIRDLEQEDEESGL